MADNQFIVKHDKAWSNYLISSNILSAPYIPPANICFYSSNGNLCGRLFIDNGVLRFEGDADESARSFFDNVIKLNSQ